VGFSVQYHPEAAAGPHDAAYLFDRFVDLMSEAALTEPAEDEREPRRASRDPGAAQTAQLRGNDGPDTGSDVVTAQLRQHGTPGEDT
jgi:carbamoyl-phosphate synthase small subunit